MENKNNVLALSQTTGKTEKPELSLISQLKVAEKSPIAVQNCMENDLNQALRYIFVLIGVPANKIPTMEIEQMVLSDFIRTSYPALKVEEIKLAFILAMRKTFEVNLELYDRMFSCLYLSTVLSEYIAWKKSVIRNVSLQLPQIEERKKTLSEIVQSEDSHRKSLEEIIQKEGKMPIIWNWGAVFRSLKRNNLIVDTPDEEKMFEELAISLFEEGAKKNRIDKKLKLPIKVDYELILGNQLATKEYVRKERIKIYYQSIHPDMAINT